MDKKTKGLNALIVILLVLTLGITVFRMTKPTSVAFKYVQCSIVVLSVLSGFAYALGGYKKNAAKFYKGFMLFFCIESLVQLIYDVLSSSAISATSPISSIFATIVCVNLCIITFATDLGKKTTVSLAYSVLAVLLINAVRMFVLYSSNIMLLCNYITQVILAVIACMFVAEKYADKTARGTK